MPDSSFDNRNNDRAAAPRQPLAETPELAGASLFRGAAEFARPDGRLSDKELTAGFISDLQPLGLRELQKVRLNLAAYLRKYFEQMAKEGFEGVVTSEGICPGLLSSSLTSAPNASRYFTGSFILPSELAMREFHQGSFSYASSEMAASLHRSIFDHLRKRNLPGTLLICANGDVAGGHDAWVTVSVGEPARQQVSSYRLGLVTDELPLEEQRQILQERAAIAALHQTGLWLGQLLHRSAIRMRLAHPSNLKDLHVVHDKLLHDAIGETCRINEHVWRKLFRSMQTTDHPGVAIGESFTGGLLGKLATSLPGSSRYVQSVYCFYHSSLKETLEVPSMHLSEGRIGEPETVAIAASGMLKHFPGKARTAITTSGWANAHWRSDGDVGSVAVLDRGEHSERLSTARVVISFSRDMEASQGRKELTRRLGVTTALYLFAHVLARADEALKPVLAPTIGGLERFLERYAELEVDHR